MENGRNNAIKRINFPRGYLRMEIRKKGYQTIEYAGPGTYARIGPDIAELKMDQQGACRKIW